MTVNKPQNASLIDTISEGYAALNRRLWLLVVPIAINAFLVYGIQISFAPLMEQLATTLRLLQAGSFSEEDLQQQDAFLRALGREDMRQRLAVLNYLPTLTRYAVGPIDDPSGAGLFPRRLYPPIDSRSGTIEVNGVGQAILVFLVVNAIALGLSAVYLTQLAEAVRGDRVSVRTWLRRTWHAGLAILGAVAIIFGIMLALGLPFVFFAGLLLSFSPGLGGLAFSLLAVLAFWVQLYTTFTREAVVVSGVGPLRAIYASFNIVRRNFWSTLGFLIVLYVITIGSSIIWRSLAQSLSTAGVVIEIVGSAYIISGLMAARMAFYRERLRRWQASQQPARQAF